MPRPANKEHDVPREMTSPALSIVPDRSSPLDYAGRMYAIAFDLDTKALDEHYGKTSTTSAYHEIRASLAKRGFDWTQGSVYFGNHDQNAVSTVVAVQEMAKEFPWFAKCVRDIRMLRIEENNDLRTALPELPAAAPDGPASLFNADANAA